MKQWEDLSRLQKLAFGCVIVIIAMFAPEIALLAHFGGIEVAFAFLAFYYTPFIRLFKTYYTKLHNALVRAIYVYKNSASARPGVFFVQASFSAVAFLFTGSLALSTCFFMPSMMLNGVLT